MKKPENGEKPTMKGFWMEGRKEFYLSLGLTVVAWIYLIFHPEVVERTITGPLLPAVAMFLFPITLVHCIYGCIKAEANQ